MPPGSALARKPVAAAILMMRVRSDGHRDVSVTCVSDACDMEFPLPAPIDEALVLNAPVVIVAADRDVLAVETAARRFFVERRLSTLVGGNTLVDPVALFGVGVDEVTLCRRLGLPANCPSDKEVARLWNRDTPTAAEGVALTIAMSRLALWAHGASLQAALPDPVFETLLPLRERLFDLEDDHPPLKSMSTSRPFNRAASFASYYRDYREKSDAGDTEARWATFEESLSYV